VDNLAEPDDARCDVQHSQRGSPVAALTSLGAGLLGWYPLLLAIGEGQSDTADDHRIAVNLALVGIASLISVCLAVVGLAKAASASAGLSALAAGLGLLLGTSAGLIALIMVAHSYG
jgi:hypothetical protein